MPQRNSYSSYDHERALNLARTGDYQDWLPICRKMQFEGWGIEVFDDAMFTEDVDLACSISRAIQSRKCNVARAHT